MVAMATNSNITVPQKYTAKYKNVGYGWDTSHPTTISKKFIILIYHYLHAVYRVKVNGIVSTIRRLQLFLLPAYAFTIDKCQGQNIRKIIVDISPSPHFQLKLAHCYVAFTRS